MIEVEHLTKYYGIHPAIQDVSFKVDKGDIMGFLGPNAAGKTTTMRILTCFMPATSGDARVAGFDIFTQPLEVRRHIGYLPESVPLYTDMTVSAYVRFSAALKGVSRDKRSRRVDAVLQSCGLQDRRDDMIAHLSKGYRQRVGLAAALVSDPPVLVLDEPTVGLDPKQIIEIRQLIKSLAGEHTIILSTHILPEVAMTCNKVVIIDDGQIVAMDTPQNLTASLKKSNSVFIAAQAPAAEMKAALKNLDGVIDLQEKPPPAEGLCAVVIDSGLESDLRSEAASVIVHRGWRLLELRPVGLSLEDIFLRLTTKEEGAE